MSSTDDDAPVPRLPRGRGLRLQRGQLMRIAMTGILLAMIIVVAQPCGRAVSGFVTGFDGSGSAAKQGSAAASEAMPRPGTVDEPAMPQHYERINGEMSESELRAAIARSKARSAGSGSALGSGSGN